MPLANADTMQAKKKKPNVSEDELTKKGKKGTEKAVKRLKKDKYSPPSLLSSSNLFLGKPWLTELVRMKPWLQLPLLLTFPGELLFKSMFITFY